MILHEAVRLFAERGFSAQTRELATLLGISEPLIYNYFPSKDDLIHEVFHEVIESRWDAGWVDLLKVRSIPLRDRLINFYEHYLEAIDDEVWIRIVMYASLDGLDMTRRYITDKVDDLLGVIATESRAEPDVRAEVDLEHLWQMQSTLVYYLVRKHIHITAVSQRRSDVIAMAVDAYLDGLPRAACDHH